jgi:chemosensory pili system protein ChpA (sensor histidine kinase/response regulator)
VGLDVVRENIQELQGSILIETDRHGGTDFIITLPLTLGVVKGLIVQLDNHRYGIPVSDIREIRRLSIDAVDSGNQRASLDGKQLPYYSLAALMGRPLPEASTADAKPLVLIMDLPGEEVVVEIPGIDGQQEMVVKELGHYLQSVRGISGASVLGDGSIVPVLNINDLALSASKPAFEEVLFTEENVKQTLTIMIVDDSISVRRVVNRFVSSLGWEVIEAKDGLEAMEKLESTNPDFILLDVEMPRMNGFEFLSKIRNISDKKDIPIAMLTSRTSGKHRKKALGLGAKGFLNKPYKDEELVDLVTQLTGFQLEDGLFVRAEEIN